MKGIASYKSVHLSDVMRKFDLISLIFYQWAFIICSMDMRGSEETHSCLVNLTDLFYTTQYDALSQRNGRNMETGIFQTFCRC